MQSVRVARKVCQSEATMQRTFSLKQACQFLTRT
jgi:hypothetical protein